MAKRGPKIIPFKTIEPLTAQSIKSYESCNHFSESEAENAVAALHVLAVILLKVVLSTTATTNAAITIQLNPARKAA